MRTHTVVRGHTYRSMRTHCLPVSASTVSVRPHPSIFVSSCNCMCPHTTTYTTTCTRTLRTLPVSASTVSVRPHTSIIHVSSYHYIYYYMYADLEDIARISEHAIRASSCFYICVLILLYICPHTTINTTIVSGPWGLCPYQRARFRGRPVLCGTVVSKACQQLVKLVSS
jgi:hypothetical protein